MPTAPSVGPVNGKLRHKPTKGHSGEPRTQMRNCSLEYGCFPYPKGHTTKSLVGAEVIAFHSCRMEAFPLFFPIL